jgi:hypothetical protein
MCEIVVLNDGSDYRFFIQGASRCKSGLSDLQDSAENAFKGSCVLSWSAVASSCVY